MTEVNMKSNLFDQVLKECHFSELNGKFDPKIKEASIKIGFSYKKIGKNLFSISVKKEKTKEVLLAFAEYSVEELIEGHEYDLIKLKFE